eukprot:366081-Chlamydomonas_euryale.AAC.5
MDRGGRHVVLKDPCALPLGKAGSTLGERVASIPFRGARTGCSVEKGGGCLTDEASRASRGDSRRYMLLPPRSPLEPLSCSAESELQGADPQRAPSPTRKLRGAVMGSVQMLTKLVGPVSTPCRGNCEGQIQSKHEWFVTVRVCTHRQVPLSCRPRGQISSDYQTCPSSSLRREWPVSSTAPSQGSAITTLLQCCCNRHTVPNGCLDNPAHSVVIKSLMARSQSQRRRGDVGWRGLRDLSRAEVVLQPMAERQCARCSKSREEG